MSFQELQQLISPKFTENVFNNILIKQSGLNDIKINKIIIGAPSKKGDSYLSNICRFTVDITGKNTNGLEQKTSVHVIVKILLSNIARRKTFRSADFFENEGIFYEKVWPVLNEFQKSKLPEDQRFNCIPLLLASHIDGEHDFIALEDLSYQGYTGADRGNGLDYNTTVSILKTFADFHGLGLACKDQTPEQFEKAATSLKETYFDEKFYSWYIKFQGNVISIIKDAVAKELPPLYLEKINAFIGENFFQELCNLCRLRGRLSVVTHGDAWVPNFLIKYSNKYPERIAMIDFQLTRYTTLINDITFFLFSCVETSLLTTKWDDFIAEYHKYLNEAIKKFGSQNAIHISIEDLYDGIKKTITFGVGMSLEALVMSLLDEDDVSDLDAIEGEDAVPLDSVWVVKPFENKEKRQRIAAMIKLVVDKQWI